MKENILDDKNFIQYSNEALKDKKFFVIWFYNSSDHFSKLFSHTLSNTQIFHKYLKFGRYPDPDNNTMKYW